MDRSKHFHFTLGPVQGFVAQARRTRDFWAGSFLLSWLSGVAMAEVVRQGGQIVFPAPPAQYLDWIVGQGRGAEPRQGGVPNRFKAQVPDDFDPCLVSAAVRQAWAALADHVWRCDGLDRLLPTDSASRTVWSRQNGGFWEINWALSQAEQDAGLIDQRKNWRSEGYDHDEPGVKCMAMEGWQELSGAEYPGKAVEEFWQALRGLKAPGMASDLGEKEHLCALAYVKRRFARHFASFQVTLDSGLPLRGWPLSTGMPSVSYMAAVHWLEQLVQRGSEEELAELLEAAQRVNPERSEWDTEIRCLREAARGSRVRRELLSLDGNLFFSHVHQQAKAYGYDAEAMGDWERQLSRFCRSHDFQAPLSPYYAILLMDGDSLGSHMSDASKQSTISQALERFTSAVPAIVQQYHGQLIYAGGDDVLAVLPLEDAMPCAAAVRAHYLAQFAGSGIPTTISAAIEFAHVKTPLGHVLADSHQLLDDVAKEDSGRDAIAVRVWKGPGLHLEWSQPWLIALSPDSAEGQLVLEQEAGRLAGLAAEDAGVMSTKFLYSLRNRFDFLQPLNDRGDPLLSSDKDIPVLSTEQVADLLAVDYLRSGANRQQLSIQDARRNILPLITQCCRVKRKPELALDDWPREARLRVDGALLVRFLATKGVE